MIYRFDEFIDYGLQTTIKLIYNMPKSFAFHGIMAYYVSTGCYKVGNQYFTNQDELELQHDGNIKIYKRKLNHSSRNR